MTNQGPESHCDLLVVGAGPAGTSAAITAARAGLRVTVIDKAKFPRDKCCGDGLTTLALRQLHALGFDPATVPSWQDVDAAYLRSPSGREVRLPLPKHGRFAAVTPRLELDAALVDHARAMGATIVEECAFVGISRNADSVGISTNADSVGISTNADSVDVAVDTKGSPSTIRATWVVAADGMWSPVRKALGVSTPGYLGEWHAFRQYANNVTGPAKDRLIVWFDEDLLPGYAWSFPLPGNRVNIGFGILRDGERRVQDMKDLWTDLLRRDHVVAALGDGFQLEDRHTAWPIPARIDEAVTAIGRILFVGDAAMATDALTGEGIGQALLTGVEAAKAVIAGGDAATVRGRYARAVNHHLLADHRMSVRLSKVLSKSRGARGAIALLARSGSWGRRNFARWMFEDEPRAIALTPRRWHRRLFRQHGAY